MSIPTTSDHLVRRLHEWGVRRVFGYPGDGINGLMGALQRAQGTIEFVQTRHEELAAFMACAHAKFTGEVGVCMATSGPGAIHLLNGLYDAQLDHQPVLAIVGQQARSALGGDYQQEVDLASLFKDVAHEYLQTITVPAQVRHAVDRALRIALDQRSVTGLIIPNDVQELDAVETPPREHGTVHSGIGITRKTLVPGADDLLHGRAGTLRPFCPSHDRSRVCTETVAWNRSSASKACHWPAPLDTSTAECRNNGRCCPEIGWLELTIFHRSSTRSERKLWSSGEERRGGRQSHEANKRSSRVPE